MRAGKGSAFERKISKQLSLWWTKGERDDVFWRSQQSGGRATIRKRAGKTTSNQEGDITAMDVCGEILVRSICIELKRGYPGFSIEDIIMRKAQKPILFSFIQQCERELTGTRRYWWLIVKQDRKEEIILFPAAFRQWLRLHGFIVRRENHLILSNLEFEITILRLTDFLNFLDPDKLREALQNEK